MPTAFQHELTDGTFTFIHDARNMRLPDHPDAKYHIPGGRIALRWRLLKAFPALRDVKREIEVPSEPGRRAGARTDVEGRARAMELAAQGVAVVEIARRLDRTAQTIRTWIK